MLSLLLAVLITSPPQPVPGRPLVACHGVGSIQCLSRSLASAPCPSCRRWLASLLSAERSRLSVGGRPVRGMGGVPRSGHGVRSLLVYHTKSFDRLGYHPIMTRQFVICLKDNSRSLQDFVSSDSLRFTTGVEAEKSHGGSNAPRSDPSTARCPPDLQARTTKPFRPGMFMNGVPFMACARNVPCPCPSRQ